MELCYRMRVRCLKKNISTYNCSRCKKIFMHYASLYKHEKAVHNVSNGNIKCLEENCTFACHYLKKLREHLTTVHGVRLEKESKMFQDVQGILCMLYE